MRLSARLFSLCLFIIALGCGESESPKKVGEVGSNEILVDESLSEIDRRIESIMESEELLQSLADSMSLIPKWLSDADVPVQTVFAGTVEYSGIDRFDYPHLV